jgi:hypothetical protein
VLYCVRVINWLTYSEQSQDSTNHSDSKLSGNLHVVQQPKQVNCGNICISDGRLE